MLQNVVAVIGSPAVGKTTLTMRLANRPGWQVFRLREHVPEVILAATATSADRVGWIDDLTVTRALQGYVERVVADGAVHAVLLDNFPGTGTQVQVLLSVLGRLAPPVSSRPSNWSPATTCGRVAWSVGVSATSASTTRSMIHACRRLRAQKIRSAVPGAAVCCILGAAMHRGCSHSGRSATRTRRSGFGPRSRR